MLYRLCLVSALALASTPTLAQDGDAPWTLQDAIGDPDNLQVSGSARVRYEALHNQFRPGLDRDDDLVTLRFTLAAEYDAGPFAIGAELMDSRAYFGDPGSSVGTGEVNALELVQAYVGVDLGDPLGEGSEAELTAGRFTMDLGSRRLVGRSNFGNTTNAFTGVRLAAKGASGNNVTVFYTWPQQRLPTAKEDILDNEVRWDHEGDDLQFWGLFANFPKALRGIDVDTYFYGLKEDDRPTLATRNRTLYTPGFRLYRAPAKGALDFELEYAHQFGRIDASTAPDARRLDVSAHFLHAGLGYRFDSPWQPRIAFEYDLATGNGGSASYGRFDGLFGPRTIDLGPTGIYGPLGRNNIDAPGIRFELKPNDRLESYIAYKALFLESASDSFGNTGVRDPAGQSGKFAGHQLDTRIRYWLKKGFLRLETGAAVLFDGGFLRDAPNANPTGDTVYGYADLTATF